MYIVLACDNNFAPYCATTIASIATNNSGVVFYLLTDNLNNSNAQLLESMTEQMGSRLNIVYVDKTMFADFPMPKQSGLSHISLATYFRLFTPILLPKEIDKIIYLDCDIIVRHNIQELYNTNINDFYIGAVYHNDELSVNNGAFKRLNIPPSQGYFNAGVLLINLKKWREDHIYDKCIEFLKKNRDNIVNHDQDVLNAVCGSKTKLLSYKWNTMNPFFMEHSKFSKDRIMVNYQKEDKSNITDPTIIHFAFRPKPWERICVHPFAYEFKKYLSLTPYKGTPPKSNSMKDLVQYVVKPILLGFGRYTFIKVGKFKIFLGGLPMPKRYKQ